MNTYKRYQEIDHKLCAWIMPKKTWVCSIHKNFLDQKVKNKQRQKSLHLLTSSSPVRKWLFQS